MRKRLRIADSLIDSCYKAMPMMIKIVSSIDTPRGKELTAEYRTLQEKLASYKKEIACT